MRADHPLPFVLACVLSSVHVASTFWLPMASFLPPHSSHRRPVAVATARQARRNTALASGYGIATNYTWKEEAYEIDVMVKVPADTRAKDIVFVAMSQSIGLQLMGKHSNTTLLDANRKLRGRVNIDGTYWVISDPDDNAGSSDYREVTVTIEKQIKTPKDDFEVIDYDWKGLYALEDEGEVTERKYDKPETLDVREYAASMGVDIDNINTSMVDKTMFSSGMNMTQRTLDELNEAGFLAPDVVTQQADGSEYITNDEGEPIPFDPLGQKPATAAAAASDPIPFLDTDSPWHKVNETVLQQKRNITRAAFAEDSTKKQAKTPFSKKADPTATDPIDLLTVKRLKEILKSQGLKVSGNKQELRDRLRSQVNSLLQGKQ